MDLSKCNCDKAGFCPVFRRQMDEKNYHWCNTTTENKRTNYYQTSNNLTNKKYYINKVLSKYKISTKYHIPENINKVEIVTVHFNPSGSTRLKQTYEEWIASLGVLGKYVKCYEIVFDDRKPEIKNSIVIRGTLAKNCLWQKEALINLAFNNTPKWKKYFLWVDHDLVFNNPRWLVDSIRKIDSGVDAVQLFEEVIYLDRYANNIHSSISRAFKNENKNSIYKSRNSHGCPGGGWIASIEKIRPCFPIPSIIIGSGDEWLAYGFYCTEKLSKPMQDQLDIYSKDVKDSLLSYIKKLCNMSMKTSFVQGKVFHLWHGDVQNRQYTTRHEIMEKHNFDPSTDVFVNQDGILELTGNNPGIEIDLLNYFKERKEDG